MSIPVCHRIALTVTETPTIAVLFMALPEEARRIESRIKSQMNPAMVALDVAADERRATSATSMVKALFDSLPSNGVSLVESISRDQLMNIALKLDFCVAMARDVPKQALRLGEILVEFQRTAPNQVTQAGEGETFCITMTDPAAEQDTDAMVGLFTRVLADVLVTHEYATRLSVTQQPVSIPERSAYDALTRLVRELDAAGLPDYADQVQTAFPEEGNAAPVETSLAA